jgi:transposase
MRVRARLQTANATDPVRDQLIGQRTATINAVRGHLAELGIVAAQRRAGLRDLLSVVGDGEDHRLPPLARELLQTLAAHLHELERKIAQLDQRLVQMTRTDEVCRRLVEIPGVGPVLATALVATVAEATTFQRASCGRGSTALMSVVNPAGRVLSAAAARRRLMESKCSRMGGGGA